MWEHRAWGSLDCGNIGLTPEPTMLYDVVKLRLLFLCFVKEIKSHAEAENYILYL